MRLSPPFALLAALLAAGCLAGEEPAPPAATAVDDNATAATLPTANATAALPYHAEGRLWVPQSQGSERQETVLDVPVNATGMSAMIMLRAGALYGPFELLTFWADVDARLLDPQGNVLAQGAHDSFQSREIHLEAADLQAGPHVLSLRTYGGSDGQAYGDYIDYAIDVS